MEPTLSLSNKSKQSLICLTSYYVKAPFIQCLGSKKDDSSFWPKLFILKIYNIKFIDFGAYKYNNQFSNIMDWLTRFSEPEAWKINFKKLDKFTLYDQNYISQINEKDQTFSCVLNCKRLNRVYSTICEIYGDLKIGLINISCRLLDQNHIVHGQWQYQRIQLARFAFRYNERSYRNIYIRTNPLNGDISVSMSFMTTTAILQDDQKFRQMITDLCHIVGQQSQMIFNTMLQIIFGKQSNQPYLKSALKVNPGFPRYMKVQKLLDKIKSLIATSSFYKIRSNISSAHKNRSYFKKIYLNTDKKFTSNPKIMQMALAYEIKFSKKYQQAQKKRGTQFIKDYIELQQKNQIQFAKHLNQGIEVNFVEPSINRQPISDVRYKQQSNNQIYYLIYNNRQIQATAKKFRADQMRQFQHEIDILEAIGRKHPNMFQAFAPKNPQPQINGWIFYRYEEEISIVDFLKKNKMTISLSTKLQIMSQICSFVQYLHKQNIGYFIHIDNIFITKNLQVKIRGFNRAYITEAWIQNKKDEKAKHLKFDMPANELISFPYRYIDINDLSNQKCDVMSMGVCLYKILMEKFPFSQKQLQNMGRQISKEQWAGYWVVQSESFLRKGGQLVKIIVHLLLKCFDMQNLFNRPYVQWLQVILCQIRTSLNGLY